MPEFTTVARPYAKAAFDFAVEHQSVERQQDMLAFTVEVTKNKQTTEFFPGTLAPETSVESFTAVCGEQLDENNQNPIRVMAEDGHFNASPDVLEQFIHLRAVSEVTVEADAISAATLSEQQSTKTSAMMEKRLPCKVKLSYKIDKPVTIGITIRAGDMVIDDGVCSRLERLVDVLQPQGGWGMQLNSIEISELIKQRVVQFNVVNEIHNEGTIVSVSDGVTHVHGLADYMQGEVISPPDNRYVITLNLECGSVDTVVMGPYADLVEGVKARRTDRILEVPAGRGLLGHVVSTLDTSIGGRSPLDYGGFSAVETTAPSVIERQPVDQSVQISHKVVDSMTPVDRGQRELIIGDRQTGKAALAIDAIIDWRDSGTRYICAAVNQKAFTIPNVVRKLEECGVLADTITMAATTSESAALQYLVPYAGCVMDEYFRDYGENALIIYDGPSRRAVVYRQISLLLHHPPGREALPGDVFCLHSRLLEHAVRINAEYAEAFIKGRVREKTGSLTALPIIGTQAGDVSVLVPTSVISVTDGQTPLETNLFNAGIRPVANPGISIFRVGSTAQTEIVKKLSDGIHTALAWYRESAMFPQLASDLDNAACKQFDHGQKVTELLKQRQYAPMSIAQQPPALFAAERGYLADVELSKIDSFKVALLVHVDRGHVPLMQEVNQIGGHNDEIEGELKGILDSFKAIQSW